MGDRAAKESLFDAFSATARALGSGRRAEIVDVLAQGERSVEELAREVGQSLANTSHHVRTVDRRELVGLVADGAVTVIDVRPPAEYAAGHIPGPCSAPPDEVQRHLAGLPRDNEIVVYCRGPYRPGRRFRRSARQSRQAGRLNSSPSVLSMT